MEQRHLAHADRLWPLRGDISGNLDDRIVRQIGNCPAVFNHHQMTAPQVEGQRAGDIDDKLAVNANVEGVRQDPGTLIFFGCGKQLFLTRRFSPYYQIGPMTWYFMYNRIYPDVDSIPRRPWN